MFRPRHRGRHRLVSLLACSIAAGVLALAPAPAAALITSPQVLAGPSGGILGVGNVAMAADGTGGVVWRQLVDGEAHVFVSQFKNGVWGTPIEVDTSDPGPATFPALAAGNGGELLVVWVQPWASISVNGAQPTTHYQLQSSVMQPGATGFGPAMQVDPDDVGDGSGVYPSVAMAPDGDAYVVYKVVTNPLTPGIAQPQGTPTPLHAGDELVDVRVAQFNGLYWSSLGTVNAAPGQVTMRKPSAGNAAVVDIDRNGDAIVVWQEPTIDGVARIWARRLYGTELGFVLEASPTTINGKQVTADADAPAVSFGDYASAMVAFRLAGGAGNPLGTPEVFTNALQDMFTKGGASFAGATAIGGATGIGAPSISIDDNGDFQAGFTAQGSSDLVTGTSSSVEPAKSLGGSQGDPALADLDPDGGGATVWPSTSSAGLPVVAVREQLPDGGVQSGLLSAPISGPISSLEIGPSGGGDALIAWQQGASSTSQVVVAEAKAPPHDFFAFTPFKWVSPAAAILRWGAATSVSSAVTYSVLVDGQVEASGLKKLRYALPPDGISQGKVRVQVIATDASNQETLSPVRTIKVDATPPAVAVTRLSGRRAQVRVVDVDSGVLTKATSVSFGDGTPPLRHRATVVHRYVKTGRYVIAVRCSDKAGNVAVDHLVVSVR